MKKKTAAELRMEGYDIARKRLYSWLMKKARDMRLSGKARLEFQNAAEYVGMFMNDYLGERAGGATK